MEFPEPLLKLLVPAVEAARAVLDDLEPEQIPVSLRRVGASSADRLPPPLARATLRELDRNEWLREEVGENWKELSSVAGVEAREATTLFLDRPDEWELRLDELASQTAQADDSTQIARLRQEVARLQAELELARKKTKAAERRIKEAERRAGERVRTSKARTEQAKTEAIGRSADLERRLAALNEQHDAIAQERDRLAARLATTRAELLRRRRIRPTAPRASISTWRFGDPGELVRHLDQLADAARRTGPDEIAAAPANDASFRFPAGVAPDEEAAISWLTARRDRFTLVVDGYNVSYQLDAGKFYSPELRFRLNSALADLSRTATASVKVVIVYDSDQGDEAATATVSGVDVRFTPPELLADQEILRLVPTLKGKVVVVSSDREVREGAEAMGALGVWSEALAAWIQRR